MTIPTDDLRKQIDNLRNRDHDQVMLARLADHTRPDPVPRDLPAGSFGTPVILPARSGR